MFITSLDNCFIMFLHVVESNSSNVVVMKTSQPGLKHVTLIVISNL